VSCQSPQPRIVQAPSVLESVAPSRNFGAAGGWCHLAFGFFGFGFDMTTWRGGYLVTWLIYFK
jgi:hypothetical protein